MKTMFFIDSTKYKATEKEYIQYKNDFVSISSDGCTTLKDLLDKLKKSLNTETYGHAIDEWAKLNSESLDLDLTDIIGEEHKFVNFDFRENNIDIEGKE